MAAGGRNPQKSAAARAKAEKRNAGKKSGGGGKSGKDARTKASGKNLFQCEICKAEILGSVKNVVKLEEHVFSKHPKNSFAECFPCETPEKRAERAALEAKKSKNDRSHKKGGKTQPPKGSDLDSLLQEGLGGKKKKKKGKRRG
eukprot:g1470.t1